MENKRKALGKGLEQLFSGEAFNLEEFEKNVVDNANKDEILMINLNELRSNPYQPRKVFDKEDADETGKGIPAGKGQQKGRTRHY